MKKCIQNIYPKRMRALMMRLAIDRRPLCNGNLGTDIRKQCTVQNKIQ